MQLIPMGDDNQCRGSVVGKPEVTGVGWRSFRFAGLSASAILTGFQVNETYRNS